MRSGLNVSNSILVTAFRSALIRQGLVALLILVSLAIIWASAREWLPGFARRGAGLGGRPPEPVGRAVARIGFGLLWVFDGILQAQPAMAAGLPGQVIAPAADGSPGWVRHLVNWAGTAWSYHPVQAGAAAVWIQVGIGVWLLAAARGPASRLAGVTSVGWGLVVWVFGEAFGGIFSPGQSLLFGAPGAALIYCAAGCLVALPDRAWESDALGRRLLVGLGTFFLGMAVLQAWPGRGFWQGTIGHEPGSLRQMLVSMSATPQPVPLARLVDDFGSLVASHGFGINAFAVAIVGILGVGVLAGTLAGSRRFLLAVVIATAAFCLADWALVQDLGFLGGLGTDPNSMIPLLLLTVAGYLGVSRVAAADRAVDEQPPADVRWRDRIKPRRLAGQLAAMRATGILAAWAVLVVLIGAAPMALAQVNRNADPIIAQAIDGSTAPLDIPAASFNLSNVSGQPVSLASLRGKVLLLTFLDPVCTTDCPLLAQELRDADRLLGTKARDVELVAIAANPLYYSAPYLRAFDQQEGLSRLRNWTYLTGSLSELRQVWTNYGVIVEKLPGGQMVAHNDLVFVIDASGRVRFEFNADPGPGTASSLSSFAVEFARAAERTMSVVR
ncbi:MAG TPA: SCO family protein [Streptosporangiaceae bacterium]|nr:SCO family protein [Streptosporangiaceae bacterium]